MIWKFFYTAEEFFFYINVCILVNVCFWLVVVVVEEKGTCTIVCPKICQLLILWSDSDLIFFPSSLGLEWELRDGVSMQEGYEEIIFPEKENKKGIIGAI